MHTQNSKLFFTFQVRRKKLLSCDIPRRALQKIVTDVGKDDKDIKSIKCDNYHGLVEKVMPPMVSALFNLFTANRARDINSVVHRKKKHGTTQVTRSSSLDKRRKLSGAGKS